MQYRVIDCRNDENLGESMISATTPEDAARQFLGEILARGGRPEHLRAKVYWQSPTSGTSMVRLYSKAIDRL